MISSSRNPRIAAVRRLSRTRERRATGQTTVDGPLLFEEALDNGVQIDEVFATPDDEATKARCLSAGIDVADVTIEVLTTLAGSVNPRGPVAVISIPEPPPLERRDTVVLWEIGDPGNAGTIIRTAAAFGFQVAATSGTVDLWAPKVLRAGVGGHFRTVPHTGLEPDPGWLQAVGLSAVAAIGTGGQDFAGVATKSEPIAIVIGNEAHGLPATLVSAPGTIAVTLEMPGGAESLNAAVAASILMYLRMTS